MCGITGFLSAKYNRDHLQAITDSVKHRGPDADGYYFDTPAGCNIGLGHRRLSIIDLSTAGNQPMYSHCGRYVMVYNGEVYNYEEIRAQKFSTHPWRSSSDSEVILEAFAKYGNECFSWLNGMFAVAIWDIKEHILTVARDHIGIKPFFYYHTAAGFIFASELKAIRKAEPLLSVNRDIIPSFLHLGYILHPHTIYQGVKKLAAGSYATISMQAGAIISYAEHSFWKIQDKISPTVLTDEAAAKKELKSLLEDAVEKQLVSDVPIGTFLSGGTDSSIITAIATKVATKKVKTFSIAVTDGKINEAPFAAAIAKQLGTEHYELPISQQQMLEMIPDFLQVYDEPFCDSSAFPTMLVSKLAREYVTVALSGDGGDELFWGYGSYLWAKRLQNPLLKIGAPLLHAGSTLLSSRYKRIGKLFAGHPSAHFKSHLFSQDHYFFTEKEINALLINGQTDFDAFNNDYTGRQLDIVEQTSFWDIENYLKDNLLVKVDRASMKYSLETRVPLLDYRLVEFALNLSPTLKINKQGVMKYLLKEVLYEYVPPALLDRPKWGFGVPLEKWLQGDLKWLVDKYCSKPVIEQAGIVKYEIVEELVRKFRAGKDNYLYNRIWALTVLHWFLYEQQD
ncbi:MAG: asparagine synthase (glutamine-hydrolyzing) [Bacteroidota bacterium]|nr:asparagine synthase (glutamine-hydrolyzing) [Bacteroidota bacterium]